MQDNVICKTGYEMLLDVNTYLIQNSTWIISVIQDIVLAGLNLTTYLYSIYTCKISETCLQFYKQWWSYYIAVTVVNSSVDVILDASDRYLAIFCAISTCSCRVCVQPHSSSVASDKQGQLLP